MPRTLRLLLGLLLSAGSLLSCAPTAAPPAASHPEDPASYAPALHIRHNLLGYRIDDPKVAVAFGDLAPERTFELIRVEDEEVVLRTAVREAGPGWGRFSSNVLLDFSEFRTPGVYRLRIGPGPVLSGPFRIGDDAFGPVQEDLLAFLRQQRCGYNPTLDRACHRLDGRSMGGSLPDSTFVDASGGWHDAGDQLKYLITSSNASGRLMLAFELAPEKFGDQTNALGQPIPNGIPDVLDEARWGLEWVLKLHPGPDLLFHQVADDRDHVGWKWPDQDPSDYGWGPNSYRVVYAATGAPQGLGEYKSEATGIANLAGRSAAVLAMASRIWSEHVGDAPFAERCLVAARELYAMGRAREGYQQGNSYGAPYRYTERTWADDMEWAAAELFKATGERAYVSQGLRYARLAANDTWMPHDSTDHYAYYPFVNVGHFALYGSVDGATRDSLAGYYREGIEATVRRARGNAFGVGVPFIWCSNNLTTALVTQILLYERMTGDTRYHEHMIRHRDWLLGTNPWGTSMFTGIPRDGEHPVDVHTSVYVKSGLEIPGGLVDGPVYGAIYRSLQGLELGEPDEFAALQNPFVVYHDDRGDYSTNEPTMDGTAGAVYLMAEFGTPASR